MFVETQEYIQGSTSELVARKVQVNGELLDNVVVVSASVARMLWYIFKGK